MDALHGNAFHRMEGGPERVVPVYQGLNGAPYHRAIYIHRDPRGEAKIVSRAFRIQLIQEPERLLSFSQNNLVVLFGLENFVRWFRGLAACGGLRRSGQFIGKLTDGYLLEQTRQWHRDAPLPRHGVGQLHGGQRIDSVLSYWCVDADFSWLNLRDGA